MNESVIVKEDTNNRAKAIAVIFFYTVICRPVKGPVSSERGDIMIQAVTGSDLAMVLYNGHGHGDVTP